MHFGTFTFTKGGALLILSEGDYYFDNIDFGSNNIDIEYTGNVRIFIKGNYNYPANNINATKQTEDSTLFFYVNGNLNMTNAGGGNARTEAFFYVEGDVTIDSNSGSAELFGGITSEGDILVSGNNFEFIYDAEGAKNSYNFV